MRCGAVRGRGVDNSGRRVDGSLAHDDVTIEGMTDGDLINQAAHVFLDLLSSIDYERLEDDDQAFALDTAAQRFNDIGAFKVELVKGNGEERLTIDATPAVAGALRVLYILIQHVMESSPEQSDEHQVIAAVRERLQTPD
jgi:hypothetical protein